MDKKTPAEKLQMLLEFSKLDSLQQLAEEIGANKQNMYDINKGKCGISKNMKERILAKYPNISKDWLDGLSDIMITSTPSISAHASGSGRNKASVQISGGSDRIAALEKEIELLNKIIADQSSQIEFLRELLKK